MAVLLPVGMETVDVYEICTVVCPGLRFYSGRCTVTGPVIEVETLGG